MRYEPNNEMTPHACLKALLGRLSIQGSNYSSKPQTIGFDTTCWKNPKGETMGRSLQE